jgi:hypothetical protein
MITKWLYSIQIVDSAVSTNRTEREGEGEGFEFGNSSVHGTALQESEIYIYNFS